MPEKVVLAYSGGLDTSIIIPWLKENYAYDVIAMVGDVGQRDDIEAVVAKAYATGASQVVVEDLREEFLTGYVFPALKAGAVYEHKYLLGTSLARPVIAKHQVEVALREGATAVAHGCTGKGNDQVRFELAYQALAPELRFRQIDSPLQLRPTHSPVRFVTSLGADEGYENSAFGYRPARTLSKRTLR